MDKNRGDGDRNAVAAALAAAAAGLPAGLDPATAALYAPWMSQEQALLSSMLSGGGGASNSSAGAAGGAVNSSAAAQSYAAMASAMAQQQQQAAALAAMGQGGAAAAAAWYSSMQQLDMMSRLQQHAAAAGGSGAAAAAAAAAGPYGGMHPHHLLGLEMMHQQQAMLAAAQLAQHSVANSCKSSSTVTPSSSSSRSKQQLSSTIGSNSFSTRTTTTSSGSTNSGSSSRPSSSNSASYGANRTGVPTLSPSIAGRDYHGLVGTSNHRDFSGSERGSSRGASGADHPAFGNSSSSVASARERERDYRNDYASLAREYAAAATAGVSSVSAARRQQELELSHLMAAAAGGGGTGANAAAMRAAAAAYFGGPPSIESLAGVGGSNSRLPSSSSAAASLPYGIAQLMADASSSMAGSKHLSSSTTSASASSRERERDAATAAAALLMQQQQQQQVLAALASSSPAAALALHQQQQQLQLQQLQQLHHLQFMQKSSTASKSERDAMSEFTPALSLLQQAASLATANASTSTASTISTSSISKAIRTKELEIIPLLPAPQPQASASSASSSSSTATTSSSSTSSSSTHSLAGLGGGLRGSSSIQALLGAGVQHSLSEADQLLQARLLLEAAGLDESAVAAMASGTSRGASASGRDLDGPLNLSVKTGLAAAAQRGNTIGEKRDRSLDAALRNASLLQSLSQSPHLSHSAVGSALDNRDVQEVIHRQIMAAEEKKREEKKKRMEEAQERSRALGRGTCKPKKNTVASLLETCRAAGIKPTLPLPPSLQSSLTGTASSSISNSSNSNGTRGGGSNALASLGALASSNLPSAASILGTLGSSLSVASTSPDNKDRDKNQLRSNSSFPSGGTTSSGSSSSSSPAALHLAGLASLASGNTSSSHPLNSLSSLSALSALSGVDASTTQSLPPSLLQHALPHGLTATPLSSAPSSRSNGTASSPATISPALSTSSNLDAASLFRASSVAAITRSGSVTPTSTNTDTATSVSITVTTTTASSKPAFTISSSSSGNSLTVTALNDNSAASVSSESGVSASVLSLPPSLSISSCLSITSVSGSSDRKHPGDSIKSDDKESQKDAKSTSWSSPERPIVSILPASAASAATSSNSSSIASITPVDSTEKDDKETDEPPRKRHHVVTSSSHEGRLLTTIRVTDHHASSNSSKHQESNNSDSSNGHQDKPLDEHATAAAVASLALLMSTSKQLQKRGGDHHHHHNRAHSDTEDSDDASSVDEDGRQHRLASRAGTPGSCSADSAAPAASAASAGEAWSGDRPADSTLSPPAKRRRKMVTDESQLRLPLQYGWRRETGIRCISNSGVRGEVIYYAPCGKIVRQYPDIVRYLERHNISEVTRDNFSFSSKMVVGEYYDVNSGTRFSEQQIHEAIREVRGGGGGATAAGDVHSPSSSVKEQERIKRLDEYKREKEELRRQKEDANRQRLYEQLRKAQEREQEKHKQKMVKEQDRERRRYHGVLVRCLDARKKFEDREKRREEAREEKRITKERKRCQREAARSLTLLLKEVHEDRELTDHAPLPAIARQPGLLLPPDAAANLYMLVEFLNNFGAVLGFDMDTLPSPSTLQACLVTCNNSDCAGSGLSSNGDNSNSSTVDAAPSADDELVSVLCHLLVCAIEDPGICNYGASSSCTSTVASINNCSNTNNTSTGAASGGSATTTLVNPTGSSHGKHTTLLGQPLAKADVTPSTVSEILKVYLMAAANHEIRTIHGLPPIGEKERKESPERVEEYECRVSQHAAFKMSLWLRHIPFSALNASQKLEIVAYIINDLLQNKSVVRQIESSLDRHNSLKTEKWKLDAKIRKLRMSIARKRMYQSTMNQNSDSNSRLTHHNDDSNLSMSSVTGGEKKKEIKEGLNTAVEAVDKEHHGEDDEEDIDEAEPESGADSDACIDDLHDQPQDVTDGKISTEMAQLELLQEEMESVRMQLFNSAQQVRATNCGQDRYQRTMWMLPHCGGPFFEGVSSCNYLPREYFPASIPDPEPRPTFEDALGVFRDYKPRKKISIKLQLSRKSKERVSPDTFKTEDAALQMNGGLSTEAGDAANDVDEYYVKPELEAGGKGSDATAQQVVISGVQKVDGEEKPFPKCKLEGDLTLDVKFNTHCLAADIKPKLELNNTYEIDDYPLPDIPPRIANAIHNISKLEASVDSESSLPGASSSTNSPYKEGAAVTNCPVNGITQSPEVAAANTFTGALAAAAISSVANSSFSSSSTTTTTTTATTAESPAATTVTNTTCASNVATTTGPAVVVSRELMATGLGLIPGQYLRPEHVLQVEQLCFSLLPRLSCCPSGHFVTNHRVEGNQDVALSIAETPDQSLLATNAGLVLNAELQQSGGTSTNSLHTTAPSSPAASTVVFSQKELLEKLHQTAEAVPIPDAFINGWWRVADTKELTQLKNVLNERGLRERELKRFIEKHFNIISKFREKVDVDATTLHAVNVNHVRTSDAPQMPLSDYSGCDFSSLSTCASQDCSWSVICSSSGVTLCASSAPLKEASSVDSSTCGADQSDVPEDKLSDDTSAALADAEDFFATLKCASPSTYDLSLPTIHYDRYGNVQPFKPSDWNASCALREEMHALEQVILLEEKITAASMQTKAWIPPDPPGRPTVKCLPSQLAKGSKYSSEAGCLELSTDSNSRSSTPVSLKGSGKSRLRKGGSTGQPLSQQTNNAVLIGRERLLRLEEGIERRYLKPPLAPGIAPKPSTTSVTTAGNPSGPNNSCNGTADGASVTNDVSTPTSAGTAPSAASTPAEATSSSANEEPCRGLLVWRSAVRQCESSAQLQMCTLALENSVAWDKSIMKAFCQFCSSGDHEEKLLLCDGCDKGYHTHCFRPPMVDIPDGDWFCFECVNKELMATSPVLSSVTPSSSSGGYCLTVLAAVGRHCLVCGGTDGKNLLHCATCPRSFHATPCATPPVYKIPRTKWHCPSCTGKTSRNKRNARAKKCTINNNSISAALHSIKNAECDGSIDNVISSQASIECVSSSGAAESGCSNAVDDGSCVKIGRTIVANNCASTPECVNMYANGSETPEYNGKTSLYRYTEDSVNASSSSDVNASVVSNSVNNSLPCFKNSTLVNSEHLENYSNLDNCNYTNSVTESDYSNVNSGDVLSEKSSTNGGVNRPRVNESLTNSCPVEVQGETRSAPLDPYDINNEADDYDNCDMGSITAYASQHQACGDDAGPHTPKKERSAKKLREQVQVCRVLLQLLEQHADSWPFLQPVNTRQFPAYKRVIRRPMDLSMVRRKLDDGSYKSPLEFSDDLQLMFNNCETFNEDDSPVGMAGHSLRAFCNQKWADLFPGL